MTSSVTFTAVAGTVYHFAVDGFNGDTGAINFNLGATNSLPTLIAFAPASGGAGVTVTLTGTNFTGATAVNVRGHAGGEFQRGEFHAHHGGRPGQRRQRADHGRHPQRHGGEHGGLHGPARPGERQFRQRAGAHRQLAPLVVTGTNGGATKEAGEPNHAGNAGRPLRVVRLDRPDNNTYTITTRGSDFDTLLAVYTGSTVSTLTEVASNDDDPDGGSTSAVTFAAQSGKTYRIAVDGFNGEAGDITLSVLPAGATTNLYSTGFEVSEGFDSVPAG